MSNDLITYGKKTIAELSYDKDNSVTLVDSEFVAGDMDSWKKQLCRKFRNGEELKSADAIIDDSVNNKRYVVEFKNQSLSQIDRTDVLVKAFDSAALLLLSKSDNLCRSDFANCTEFILVYNASIPDTYEKISDRLRKYANNRGRDWNWIMNRIKAIAYCNTRIQSVSDFLGFLVGL